MKKVLMGLSGGVDSAVSALLLRQKGYEVIGCTLIMGGNSGSEESVQSAKDVADKLGIKYITADFSSDFKRNVTDFFISEYLNGRTPNPCSVCNPSVKFAALEKVADSENCDLIATGHYAQISRDGETGLCTVSASPSKKDQSYFLYRLGQNVLQRTLFPLGEYVSKDEIRSIGSQYGFFAAEQKDSQDICFIPDNDYIGFILKNSNIKPVGGDFLDIEGKKIGTHSGIFNYTVGQRKGLGAFGEPRYVKSINPLNNTVTLCKGEERFSLTAKTNNLFWTLGTTPDENKIYGVKIRSTAKATDAELSVKGDTMEIRFLSPVLSPCPGQAAVVYDGDRILGGGSIF